MLANHFGGVFEAQRLAFLAREVVGEVGGEAALAVVERDVPGAAEAFGIAPVASLVMSLLL
ncbi:hypothetical protein [Sphingomonas sp.]|uniref:hypothetical protein n=1 Tax=Sphingomonas sp. TaxID=28214 RepID=UPI0037521628